MLSRVGDKWTVMVVTFLGTESLRFSELKRRIGSISQKMLTTTLRNLERDGFVNRTVEPTSPPSVRYELTELGHDLLEPVSRLADWTRENTRRIEEARSHYDRLTGKQPGVQSRS
ncbi:helix-turn-helix transcriptional regulator [Hoeflea sp. WL0058]|uniref:Helix-turn-helix transcriptional regulator n=2 Tax=Flavimaribacter sediminis TaxID=2865987 RepID=A0AAE2ZPV8_9HYPH|nr:helix-turn-helix transcriptional regulator [Flavimaribacter sediminis]